MSNGKQPPAHLSAEMQAWWRRAVRTWTFSSHHLKVLQAACEAWDRMTEARTLLKDQGLTVTDRFGQQKPHPAFAIERDSRTSFVRCVRELALADEHLPDSRPPRLSGYDGRD